MHALVKELVDTMAKAARAMTELRVMLESILMADVAIGDFGSLFSDRVSDIFCEINGKAVEKGSRQDVTEKKGSSIL